ncbi:anti-sigma factor RsbA family regulatory protein [Planomonospora corallina]|uniref:Anti-sigma factor RsbA family regulatory protein n=1 Tax=Planomonospora corallina TaxID=1806052 RepID=A0ABV8IAR4_9ACTN
MTPDRPPRLTHHALLYDCEQSLLDTATRFCLDGLGDGDAVLVVTTPATIAQLRHALGSAASRVEFADSRTWYDTPGRALAAYHRHVTARTATHHRIRILGEPVWHGRHPRETLEWTRCESIANVALADSPAWIVCPYDTRALPAHLTEDAQRTHPHLTTGAHTRPSPLYTDPEIFTRIRDHRPTGTEPTSTGPTSSEPAATLRFDHDLGKVRAFLTTQAAALGLPDTDTAKLVFAANEVATNAVQHGGGTGEIRLHRHGPALVCDVHDSGRLTAPFPGYLPPTTPHHGRGLWAVRQLCDLVEIHRNRPGTLVRLHLTLTPPART